MVLICVLVLTNLCFCFRPNLRLQKTTDKIINDYYNYLIKKSQSHMNGLSDLEEKTLAEIDEYLVKREAARNANQFQKIDRKVSHTVNEEKEDDMSEEEFMSQDDPETGIQRTVSALSRFNNMRFTGGKKEYYPPYGSSYMCSDKKTFTTDPNVYVAVKRLTPAGIIILIVYIIISLGIIMLLTYLTYKLTINYFLEKTSCGNLSQCCKIIFVGIIFAIVEITLLVILILTGLEIFYVNLIDGVNTSYEQCKEPVEGKWLIRDHLVKQPNFLYEQSMKTNEEYLQPGTENGSSAIFWTKEGFSGTFYRRPCNTTDYTYKGHKIKIVATTVNTNCVEDNFTRVDKFIGMNTWGCDKPAAPKDAYVCNRNEVWEPFTRCWFKDHKYMSYYTWATSLIEGEMCDTYKTDHEHDQVYLDNEPVDASWGSSTDDKTDWENGWMQTYLYGKSKYNGLCLKNTYLNPVSTCGTLNIIKYMVDLRNLGAGFEDSVEGSWCAWDAAPEPITVVKASDFPDNFVKHWPNCESSGYLPFKMEDALPECQMDDLEIGVQGSIFFVRSKMACKAIIQYYGDQEDQIPIGTVDQSVLNLKDICNSTTCADLNMAHIYKSYADSITTVVGRTSEPGTESFWNFTDIFKSKSLFGDIMTYLCISVAIIIIVILIFCCCPNCMRCCCDLCTGCCKRTSKNQSKQEIDLIDY